MHCLNPIQAYFAKQDDKPTGKREVTFDPKRISIYNDLKLPCGQCMACRLNRSREWAIRCVNEASLHDHNHFLTLTFKEENDTLNKEDFQKFMKRLRKNYYQHYKKITKKYIKDLRKQMGNIKYYHCGEYGEKLGRPHHHACLFNLKLWDLKPWKKTESGMLHTSEFLTNTWKHGHVVIGEVNFDTAAYVARYITKKITGDPAEQHYTKYDMDGYRKKIQEEYNSMSLKPAIGKSWIEKYWSDIYPHDEVTYQDGKKCRPPRYYDKWLEANHSDLYQIIKDKREPEVSHDQQDIEREKDKIINNYIRLKQDHNPRRPFEYTDIQKLPNYDQLCYNYKIKQHYDDKNSRANHERTFKEDNKKNN